MSAYAASNEGIRHNRADNRISTEKTLRDKPEQDQDETDNSTELSTFQFVKNLYL